MIMFYFKNTLPRLEYTISKNLQKHDFRIWKQTVKLNSKVSLTYTFVYTVDNLIGFFRLIKKLVKISARSDIYLYVKKTYKMKISI